jgi:hypothetical protein
MERISAAVPLWSGRGAGVAYLFYLLTTALTEFFTEQAGAGVRAVFNNPAATATSIVTHESLYELGFALHLVSIGSYVAVAALFYRLFRPVNRNLSLLATFWALTRIGIWSFATSFLLVPLIVLRGSTTYLSGFTANQLQGLAVTFLNLHTQAYSMGFVFEGLYWISIGFLWFRSTFLTPVVGAVFAIAGMTYMVFLAPPLASALLVYVGVFTTLAELTMVLWLAVKGVNLPRWIERATAAGIVDEANCERTTAIHPEGALSEACA